MKKLLPLFLIGLLFSVPSFSQNQSLSENAEISVLTVGPGKSLNDAFGHSGFRVKDDVQGLDVVFGYGEYDFEAPNFYLKFARGKLNYKISRHTFERFYKTYVYFNRTVKEQVLNLNQFQKQKLYNALVHNYKPENRAYLYDFFFDNCATRIRDVANTSLNNSITYSEPKDYQEATFRTLIHNNLNKNSWGSLGIDIALGAVIDRIAIPEEQMFLPEKIHDFFEEASHNNDQLVKNSQVLYTKKEETLKSNILFSPLVILSFIAAIILWITYKDFKFKKRSKWLDITVFSVTGLIGVFLLLLWFATDHTATANNYNLLWAFALNIFMLGQLKRSNPKNWFLKYLKLLLILLALMVFHWLTKVQVFAITLIPLILALACRYVFLVFHFQNNNSTT